MNPLERRNARKLARRRTREVLALRRAVAGTEARPMIGPSLRSQLIEQIRQDRLGGSPT
jgi:hypothetical protein